MTPRFTRVRCGNRVIHPSEQSFFWSVWCQPEAMTSRRLALIIATPEAPEIADRLIQRWRSTGLIRRIGVNRMLGWKVNTTKP